jgi:hypothetical protein
MTIKWGMQEIAKKIKLIIKKKIPTQTISGELSIWSKLKSKLDRLHLNRGLLFTSRKHTKKHKVVSLIIVKSITARKPEDESTAMYRPFNKFVTKATKLFVNQLDNGGMIH